MTELHAVVMSLRIGALCVGSMMYRCGSRGALSLIGQSSDESDRSDVAFIRHSVCLMLYLFLVLCVDAWIPGHAS
jgi:hypothetical protein